MNLTKLSEGILSMLRSVPEIEDVVSAIEVYDESGNAEEVPAIFRNRAPQSARLPYCVFHHLVTPPRYSSCGTVTRFESQIQIDAHAQSDDECDEILSTLCEHLDYAEGVYEWIEVDGVFIDDVLEEDSDDVESDGDHSSSKRMVTLRVHWSAIDDAG